MGCRLVWPVHAGNWIAAERLNLLVARAFAHLREARFLKFVIDPLRLAQRPAHESGTSQRSKSDDNQGRHRQASHPAARSLTLSQAMVLEKLWQNPAFPAPDRP
jgi:hypothetical protein